MKKIRAEFQRLRNESRYGELGWFFWNGFLMEKGKIRKLYQQLWRSLTKLERENCESV